MVEQSWPIHTAPMRQSIVLIYAFFNEGWHNRFNRAISKHHPNIWLFLRQIQQEQAAVELLHQQLTFMSCNFMSCIFMPCHLVRQLHVLQFHALQFWWSVIFMSVIFSAPTPSLKDTLCGNGSQCKRSRIAWATLDLNGKRSTSRAAARRTDCSRPTNDSGAPASMPLQ